MWAAGDSAARRWGGARQSRAHAAASGRRACGETRATASCSAKSRTARPCAVRSKLTWRSNTCCAPLHCERARGERPGAPSPRAHLADCCWRWATHSATTPAKRLPATGASRVYITLVGAIRPRVRGYAPCVPARAHMLIRVGRCMRCCTVVPRLSRPCRACTGFKAFAVAASLPHVL